MRPSVFIACTAFIATAAAAQTGAPSLKVFTTFTPGQYKVEPRDQDSRNQIAARPICLASPAALIRDGANPADGCGYTVVDNSEKAATVTYSCKMTGAGRTTMQTVDGHYRVQAQGFKNSMPFETTVDYHRVGDCTK